MRKIKVSAASCELLCFSVIRLLYRKPTEYTYLHVFVAYLLTISINHNTHLVEHNVLFSIASPTCCFVRLLAAYFLFTREPAGLTVWERTISCFEASPSYATHDVLHLGADEDMENSTAACSTLLAIYI